MTIPDALAASYAEVAAKRHNIDLELTRLGALRDAATSAADVYAYQQTIEAFLTADVALFRSQRRLGRDILAYVAAHAPREGEPDAAHAPPGAAGEPGLGR